MKLYKLPVTAVKTQKLASYKKKNSIRKKRRKHRLDATHFMLCD